MAKKSVFDQIEDEINSGKSVEIDEAWDKSRIEILEKSKETQRFIEEKKRSIEEKIKKIDSLDLSVMIVPVDGETHKCDLKIAGNGKRVRMTSDFKDMTKSEIMNSDKFHSMLIKGIKALYK